MCSMATCAEHAVRFDHATSVVQEKKLPGWGAAEAALWDPLIGLHTHVFADHDNMYTLHQVESLQRHVLATAAEREVIGL